MRFWGRGHGILVEQVSDGPLSRLLASGRDHLAHKTNRSLVPAFPRVFTGLRRLDVLHGTTRSGRWLLCNAPLMLCSVELAMILRSIASLCSVVPGNSL